MKLAFYNGRSEGAKFVHKGILAISDPFTHVELIFTAGISCSSEFGIGPRFKKITYTHPERWQFVDLSFITPEQEARVRYRAEVASALRKAGFIRYDTTGAIRCATTGGHNPWNFFCSEIVYEVLAPEIALPVLNHKMHPQRLLEVIEIIKDIQTF